MHKQKRNCVYSRPTMHCCAMFFLLLIFMTELLSTANSANCLDGLVRKPPRFGKRSDFGFIGKLEQVHPCFAQLQRRSDRLAKLKIYFDKVQPETGEIVLEKSDVGLESNTPNLLLKLFSVLRRKNDQ